VKSSHREHAVTIDPDYLTTQKPKIPKPFAVGSSAYLLRQFSDVLLFGAICKIHGVQQQRENGTVSMSIVVSVADGSHFLVRESELSHSALPPTIPEPFTIGTEVFAYCDVEDPSKANASKSPKKQNKKTTSRAAPAPKVSFGSRGSVVGAVSMCASCGYACPYSCVRNHYDKVLRTCTQLFTEEQIQVANAMLQEYWCPHCTVSAPLDHRVLVEFDHESSVTPLVVSVLSKEIGFQAPVLPMLGPTQLEYNQQLFITRDLGEKGSSQFVSFGSQGVLVGYEDFKLDKDEQLVVDFAGAIHRLTQESCSTVRTTLPDQTTVYAVQPLLLKESSETGGVVITPGTKGEIVGTTADAHRRIVKFAHPSIKSTISTDAENVAATCELDVVEYAQVCHTTQLLHVCKCAGLSLNCWVWLCSIGIRNRVRG
jgi:hypothetical protein